MRVIAGKYRSRPLHSLKGADIRPTADRLRETLFNILTAGNPEALQGTIWLDLYAGTGAVGIEAISRGAEMVYFVESSVPAADLIKSNLASLKIERGFKILRMDAVLAIRALAKDNVTMDFGFFDPPYQMQTAYAQMLDGISKTNVLKVDGIVIAEHEKRFDPEDSSGLKRFRRLQQGDAALSFYRLNP